MSIGKINPVQSPLPPKRGDFKANPKVGRAEDSIQLSKKALEKAEFESALKITKASGAIRAEKVQQAKANLHSYLIGDKIRDQIADRIAQKIVDELL